MVALLDRLVSRVVWVLVAVAGLALVTVVLIVMTEVIMRALGSPLVGGIELIRVAFLVSVFFAFAYVLIAEREIRVDVIRGVVPFGMLRYMDALANIVSALFFGFLLYFSVARLHDAVVNGIYLEGRLLIPMWIPWGTIVIGSMMAVIAAVAMTIRYAVTRPKSADGGLPAAD